MKSKKPKKLELPWPLDECEFHSFDTQKQAEAFRESVSTSRQNHPCLWSISPDKIWHMVILRKKRREELEVRQLAA